MFDIANLDNSFIQILPDSTNFVKLACKSQNFFWDNWDQGPSLRAFLQNLTLSHNLIT